MDDKVMHLQIVWLEKKIQHTYTALPSENKDNCRLLGVELRDYHEGFQMGRCQLYKHIPHFSCKKTEV